MPIYEFYCAPCHRVYPFFSRRVDTEKAPACPKCGQARLVRRASAFAISRGRPEAAPGDAPAGEGDEEKLARAMESLAAEAEGVRDDDPRQAARLMRRVFETAGLPVGGGMEEALRRLEAGEDPDAVEREMGDLLEGETAGTVAEGGALHRPTLRSRLRPPPVDGTLYEL